MTGTMSPDADQLGVINSDPRGRLVVTAGPGSGKTFTAALRAAKIVEAKNGVDDDLPVLALSFSRAAAHALRSACWRSGCRSGIQFSTLDSWAGTYLAKVSDETNDDPRIRNYDQAIERATAFLRSLSDDEYLCSHLIVDEAQDVTGPRRELVVALMRRSTMGWTILGDLAQKIFDFEDPKTASKTPPARTVTPQGEGRILVSDDVTLPKYLLATLEHVPEEHRESVLAALRETFRPVSTQAVLTERGPALPATRKDPTKADGSADADVVSILEQVLERSSVDQGIVHLKLTVDHRATTDVLRSVRRLGDILRTDKADNSTVDALWGAFLDTKNHVGVNLKPGVDAKDELSGKLRVWGRKATSTAVLVRSTSDLLVLSRHLASLGEPVPHDIIHTRDQEIIPAWVAGLSGAESEEELRESIPEALDRDVVLSMLRAQFMNSGRLDAARVAAWINSGRTPEFLKTQVSRGVILSTIHRVKGLEFDRVVLGNWKRPDDDGGLLPESRLMFVGLTRASGENWGLNLEHGTTIKPFRNGSTRRAEYRHIGQRAVPIGIEVKNVDIHLLRPVPESVELVLCLDKGHRGTPSRYVLQSADGDQAFGFTLDGFGQAAEAIATIRKSSIPERLTGLVRTGTCTIAPDAHLRHAWNGKTLAVAPVLAGIATWKEE